MQVTELVGVYDADGSLLGEVRYWLGARLGRAHCALCDITHGTFRRRPEWDRCEAALPVPFRTYHRDDQPDDVRVAADGRTPVVVARCADGSVVPLVDSAGLDALHGDAEALVTAITEAAAARGLVLSRAG